MVASAPERVTWSGTFVDPTDERAFRDARRSADDAVVRLLGILTMVSHVTFAFVDRALLAGTRELVVVLVLRGVTIALAVGILLSLKRMSVRTVDRTLVALMLIVAPFQFVVALTRPPTFTGPLGATVLLVAFTTLILPLRLRSAAPLSALACLAHLAARVYQGVDAALATSTIGILLITWISAVLVSASFKRSRRLEFLATREQNVLREKLETALAEIRTLRGIVPICAFCKKIRDEAGSWQRVEEYVRDRTHAEFSHGFCPTCAEEHYGESALED